MAGRSTFSTRTVCALVLTGLLAFSGALYLMVFENVGGIQSSSANTFSRSAIGHRALVETLKQMGIAVLVSRYRPEVKAGDGALLVIAEPDLRKAGDEWILKLEHATRVFVVMPKRKGTPDRNRPDWIRRAEILPADDIGLILQHVAPKTTLKRVQGPIRWQQNRFNTNPTINDLQLMTGGDLTPIVASDQGILVGERDNFGHKVWILSDPDVLSNHGLGLGDNAVFITRLIEALRPEGGVVIFDETVHGFHQEPSLKNHVLQLPYIVVVLMAGVTIAVMIWATIGRFGAPVPLARSIATGKSELINNTASLLYYGGHGAEILQRYFTVMLRQSARQIHAPKQLDEDGVVEWLARVAESRGIQFEYHALNNEINVFTASGSSEDSRVVALAQRLYSWKQEIIHGSGDHPISGPTAQAASRKGGRRPGSGG